MKNHISFLLIFITISFVSCAQQVESEVKVENPKNLNYTTELVVKDLNIPWGITFLPDSSILITEKSGELILFKNNKKIKITGLPEIYNRGQGGLLDVIIHPKYKENGWIYFSYASEQGEGNGGNTAIMRAKIDGNKLVNNQLLYKAEPNTTKGQHFGSRLAFDNDDFLYFSVGDRGNRDENPQDITRDGGKIYRLNDDGTIPTDNPFVNEPNAKKAIYSFGHRNPQGMFKHPTTGEIWTHEHGPQGGDEINIIKKGLNYGWPKISYGINYSGTSFTEHTSLPGMEQPLFYWVPSIAPSGFAIVSSDKYPDWKGSLLVGSLKFQYLERLVLDKDKVIKREKLFEGLGRVRSVRQGPDGYIYVGIENLGIVKIVSKL
ncbi:PQQ-dependent sugar dehydrogenase [Aureibaculum marinum]|uniref:PQQ-dependent sugar dehydrogenase n=1 Tax=Aureibaculum marinum TaxID=2487930 RepID=A0A3N4NUA0_9FLAO|nr:PQQ-dependent sugar dehydrogenase [Aureibaculum marinum]RPD99951.1 PQQ-dependent sugar dehydrogenase [Aureibaculum marinum]